MKQNEDKNEKKSKLFYLSKEHYPKPSKEKKNNKVQLVIRQKEIETRPQRNCTGAEDSLHQPAREGLYCRGRRVLRKQIQTVPCRPHQGLFRGA